MAKKLKLVVIFEGRTSAGKGGYHQTGHAAAQSSRRPYWLRRFGALTEPSAASGTSSAMFRICSPHGEIVLLDPARATAPVSKR